MTSSLAAIGRSILLSPPHHEGIVFSGNFFHADFYTWSRPQRHAVVRVGIVYGKRTPTASLHFAQNLNIYYTWCCVYHVGRNSSVVHSKRNRRGTPPVPGWRYTVKNIYTHNVPIQQPIFPDLFYIIKHMA